MTGYKFTFEDQTLTLIPSTLEQIQAVAEQLGIPSDEVEFVEISNSVPGRALPFDLPLHVVEELMDDLDPRAGNVYNIEDASGNSIVGCEGFFSGESRDKARAQFMVGAVNNYCESARHADRT